MPRKIIEYDESSSDSSEDDTKKETKTDIKNSVIDDDNLPTLDDNLPTLDEELQRVANNTKLQLELQEQKKRALEEKRKRLAEPKAPKITGNRKGRYEKGSDQAREWALKMAEARKAKREERVSEKQKLEELQKRSTEMLFETKEAQIKALQTQLEKYQKIANTPPNTPVDIPPHPKTRVKKVKQVVETETDTDADPEVIKVKKQVRKKRVEKEVAQATAQDEKEKMRQEMLRQAQASIFGR